MKKLCCVWSEKEIDREYCGNNILENSNATVDVFVQQNNSIYTVIIDSNFNLGGILNMIFRAWDKFHINSPASILIKIYPVIL